jgi:uncharacterized damage-inducible protein DinB
MALTLAVSLGSPGPAAAQSDPLTVSIRQMYDPVKRNLLASANELSDELFGFRPSADVRTVGQLFAHIANAEFAICSAAMETANPHPADVERENLAPAAIRRVLAESFALCDQAYAALTDAALAGQISFFGSPQSRHFALTYNLVHASEHYGNLVTYMRIKGIVPPSSR